MLHFRTSLLCHPCYRDNLLILIMVGLLALSACSTSGNQKLKDQTQSSIEETIVPKKSTKQSVKDEFGAPYSSITADDGTEIWIYKYQHGTPWARNFIPIYNLFDSVTDLDITEMIVSFDNKGFVKKRELRKISDVSKRGITVQ